MSWEDELRIEKGVIDKVKGMIKKIKDASFKRKLGKFLKRELDVKYSEKPVDMFSTKYTRTTDRKDDLEKAKNVLLQVVEEVYDKTFPESYLQVWDVLDDA